MAARSFVQVPGAPHLSSGAQAQTRLTAWAEERGLIRSRKPACGHSLRDRSILGLPAEEHETLCTAAILGDRPSLWAEDGRPVVVVTALWVFRTGAGRRAVKNRICQYAQRFGLGAWLGSPTDPADQSRPRRWDERDFGRNGSSTVFLCRWGDADRLPTDGRLR